MRRSSNIEGAALMTASMAAFTFNDMFFKLLNEDLPFFQVLFLRSLAVTVLMIGLARMKGALWIRAGRKDWGLVLLRSLAEVGAAYFFLTALVHLPIANVTAILQALPLTVTLGAALFLGEPVGWKRFAAIGIGLVGVMLIVRPGGEGFDLYAIYAVLAVVCVTVRDLAARQIAVYVPSIFVALVAIVAILLFAAVGAVNIEWKPMHLGHGAYLAGCSVFILGAYLFSVMAMRVGEIGFVSPFRYTSLLVALLVGLVVFREWPDALTLLGAGIVVATGVFTLWRERQVKGGEL